MLRKLRIRKPDLEWLVQAGYLIPIPMTKSEPTRPALVSIAEEKRCFALTGAATECLEQLSSAFDVGACEETREALPPDRPTPEWRLKPRQLWYQGILVKHFRRSAPNQERILAAFEEQAWPVRILDPFPYEKKVAPVERLHDAVKRLNVSLEVPCLRFGGDGQGAGVCWRAIPMDALAG
jgi:hypothetical protein